MANQVRESRHSLVAVALAALILLFVLPLLLIGVGVFEELVMGTRVSHRLYRALGIFDPLENLFDGIRALFGF